MGEVGREDRDDSARGPRVLALRVRGVVGFCTAVPAYRALRRAFPRHRLVLATRGDVAPLAGLVDAVDEVLPTDDLDEPLRWRGPSPDVAVNLQDDRPASRALLQSLWPARTVAFSPAAGAPGVEGPSWEDDEPEVARWCRLLASFGIAADAEDLTLAHPARRSPWPGAALVHVGARSGADAWPAARFAEVSQELVASGYEVVVSGVAPGRHEGFAGRVLDEPLGIAGLASTVAGAALVVSRDSGAAHLAVGFGTPSVTVCGRPPERTGLPVGRPRHILLPPLAATAGVLRSARDLLAPLPRSAEVLDLTRTRPREATVSRPRGSGGPTRPASRRGPRGPWGVSGAGPRGPGRD